VADPRVTQYGDRAWLVEFEPRVAVDVSASVLHLAGHLRECLGHEASDIVPAVASLCVHAGRDADLKALDARLRELVADALAVECASSTGPASPNSRLVEIPVVYGGDAGPDLPAVAAATGLSEAEVVRRHAAGSYHVFMLGFMPGFPYLGPVDASIHVPRLATPRGRVPAGSVGLAGAQTGIYPRQSPGGWQIIGRTAEWLFDTSRTPPARLAPGDRVRFLDVTPGADGP
jgi:KipI family sensor histidine kinase inhibitor